jgi:segregation and condensation protein A
MTEARVDASYRVALPEFEGPLDLLLHLCKTHEIEIVNIPIAFITEKYLEYLDVMQSLSVDLAADYLVMAATLAYLKSRELVPAPEALEATEDENGGEEVLDPREELIRRLLEYQKYKNAAALLGERPIEGRNIFGRGMEIESGDGPAPLADHSVWKLIEAFGKLLEKAGPKVTHEVLFDRISIGARINQVIDKLEIKGGALRFDELFDLTLPEGELRGQLVVTLLAMLELARLRVVRVLASEDGETLVIAQVEGAALAEARRARLSSDAESVADAELVADADPSADVEHAAAAALSEDPELEGDAELDDDAPLDTEEARVVEALGVAEAEVGVGDTSVHEAVDEAAVAGTAPDPTIEGAPASDLAARDGAMEATEVTAPGEPSPALEATGGSRSTTPEEPAVPETSGSERAADAALATATAPAVEERHEET